MKDNTNTTPLSILSLKHLSTRVKEVIVLVALVIVVIVFVIYVRDSSDPFKEMGGTLYFAAAPVTENEAFDFDVYTLNVLSGEIELLFPEKEKVPYRYGAALSPAGDKIAYGETMPDFINRAEIYLQIYIQDIASGSEKQMTNGPEDIPHYYKRNYTWSPSGKKLAFSAIVPSPKGDYGSTDPAFLSLDNWETFVINVETRDLQYIGKGIHPSWSPDGHYLVTLQSGGIEIFDLEKNTSELFTANALVGRIGEEILLESGFDISPDGKKFAFTNPSQGEINVFRIDLWSPFTAQLEKVFDPPELLGSFEVVFSPDGKYILAEQADWSYETQYSPIYFAVYDVESGEWKKLTNYLTEFDHDGFILGDWK